MAFRIVVLITILISSIGGGSAIVSAQPASSTSIGIGPGEASAAPGEITTYTVSVSHFDPSGGIQAGFSGAIMVAIPGGLSVVGQPSCTMGCGIPSVENTGSGLRIQAQVNIRDDERALMSFQVMVSTSATVGSSYGLTAYLLGGANTTGGSETAFATLTVTELPVNVGQDFQSDRLYFPNRINSAGQVVGSIHISTGDFSALLWVAGEIHHLPMLPGGNVSVANDINNTGQMVGWAENVNGDIRAVSWSGGDIEDLGVLQEGYWSVAMGINNRGQIVGSSGPAPKMEGEIHAVKWDEQGIADLGPQIGDSMSMATHINDVGQIVGWSGLSAENPRAVIWEDGTIRELKALPGDTVSLPEEINNSGQIVGVSWSNQNRATHAVIWENGQVTALGNFDGAWDNWAESINESGQIVGTSGPTYDGFGHAVLWDNGELIDLGTLQGDTMSWATSINDAGQVVGWSGKDVHERIFIWQDGEMIELNVRE